MGPRVSSKLSLGSQSICSSIFHSNRIHDFVCVKADNSDVESWTVSPLVLLAVTSTAVNILIHVVLVRGAVSTWWYLIMHPVRQSRVQNMHWLWAAAGGLVDALKSMFVRGLSKTAIACSLATIAAINSPFLQRTFAVRTQERISVGIQVGLVYAAPRVSLDIYPYITAGPRMVMTPTKHFSDIMGDYFNKSPMQYNDDFGIPSGTIYTTKIKAAGYYFNCTAKDIEQVPGEAKSSVSVPYRPDIFLSSVAFQQHDPENTPTYSLSPQESPSLLEYRT
ncbi:hypothetical protein QBC36DRAFT_356310 [Triangularia setosa]|uniref:Uncharacterized protein n=1 Tax=Triangularia setosa TaxID=2587417 RepID=A0AAN6WEW9_9PEZI|nr:hypothetical protein QBC36DRAFT_356310 [Podospora setosa]